ncbi:MAG: hypothetical protein ACTHMC_28925 [Pseudobacter sp.]|uniref:hypothetical protein n=1 Tax=Pseudobacter sp. TaxID=2045420 RepID=UPI003F807D4E
MIKFKANKSYICDPYCIISKETLKQFNEIRVKVDGETEEVIIKTKERNQNDSTHNTKSGQLESLNSLSQVHDLKIDLNFYYWNLLKKLCEGSVV